MTYGSIPELLAPAGSPEALRAAVAAGADAVYLSGQQFGARRFAANFDETALRDAVCYCHLRGVSVYVTVNTLIRDDELVRAAEELLWLYETGVDAVLIQDAGLVSVAHRVVPDLILHASTQMTIHNSEGVVRAAKQGIRRLVLPRELSVPEIERIHKSSEKTDVGLEVFIHGALCYCYSGQCLFSSMLGGRSGNRGMCAQPCRKPYELVKGFLDEYGRSVSLMTIHADGNYLLSPRDLCTYPRLDEVLKASVHSLKIEGRMKSPKYVAIVVSVYRKALDAIFNGKWKPSPEVLTDLMMVFNRDFTCGYLLGDRGPDLMGHERPDNRGIEIGEVADYNQRSGETLVTLNGRLSPAAGDGIVFRQMKSGSEDIGMTIRPPFNVRANLLKICVPVPVSAGSKVYLTTRVSLNRRAKEIIEYRAGNSERRVELDLTVQWDEGTPILSGVAWCGRGPVDLKMMGDFTMEPARNRPLTSENIEGMLRKTGDTPFIIRNLNLDYPGGLFAPVSMINNLRRSFLSLVEERINEAYRPSPDDVADAGKRLDDFKSELNSLKEGKKNKAKCTIALSAYVNTLDGVFGAVKGGCRYIYFEPEIVLSDRKANIYGICNESSLIGDIRKAAVYCMENAAELYWKWPRITTMKFLDFAVPLIPEMETAGISGIMVENPGTAEAIRAKAPGIPVLGSVGLNIFNHLSVKSLSDICSHVTLSQELSIEEIKGLIHSLRSSLFSSYTNEMKVECIVQGPVELMVTKDCLLSSVSGCGACRDKKEKTWWGIRDRHGAVFPVSVDGECYTHIYNSVETCLVDDIPALIDAGVDSIAIDCRNKTGAYAEEMASVYSSGISVAETGESGMKKELNRLKEKVRNISAGGITKGHLQSPLKEK